MSLEQVREHITALDSFLIATHYNPDADTIGSALALYQGLTSLGKDVMVLCRDRVPKDCRFLPFNDKIHNFQSFLDSGFKPECLIIVDCNSIKRVSQDETEQSTLSSLHTTVIDHHEISGSFGDIRWIEPDSASTTMMIYRLLNALEVDITSGIAHCLYAGLCIDTGNFRHDNTSPESLRIASELVRRGVTPSRVYRELFESWSTEKFRLFKETLKGIEEESGVAILVVTKDMLERTGCDDEDAGNFVDFPKRAVSIKVSALIRESEKNKYRVSIRSKGSVNVSVVASEYGGGGHKNAAGCTIGGDLSDIKRGLFLRLKKAIEAS